MLVNHNIRKNSYKEALQVKNLLKKYKIKLNILSNKKKLIKIFKVVQEKLDMIY